MLKDLFTKLWHDEVGSVIATEYLMLGSIVGLGGASGLVAMRDGMIDEYKEFGQSVRGIRQSYSYPSVSTGVAGVRGATVTNNAPVTQAAAKGGDTEATPVAVYACP